MYVELANIIKNCLKEKDKRGKFFKLGMWNYELGIKGCILL